MAIAKTIYVDRDATGSADGTSLLNAYTSIQTAQATEAANITGTAGDYLFLIYSTGGTAFTTTVQMSTSWICDSTHRVIFQSASGYEAIITGWSDSRVRLSVTDASALLVQNYGANVLHLVIDGLQIERIFSSVQYQRSVNFDACPAGTTITMQNCRIRTNNSSLSGVYCADSDINLNFYNNIIEGTTGIALRLLGTANVDHNIITGSATYGISIPSGVSATIKNNIIFSTADDIIDSASSTIDYNASDDGDGTNAIAASGSDWANEIPNYATGDYNPANGGNIYHGGIATSLTTDISGYTYNDPPTVGPKEYEISVSGLINLLSGKLNMLLRGKL